MAPAGLLRAAEIDWARPSSPDEHQVANDMVAWLEGGELVVTFDWKDKVARGEMVAETVRDWQMKVHKGHAASIVAICRDGGIMDGHADFQQLNSLSNPTMAILGDSDPTCTREGLRGVDDIVVIPQTSHTVVREQVSAVAAAVESLWREIDKGISNEPIIPYVASQVPSTP